VFLGVGFGTIVSTFLFSVYYAVIIGWMLFYFCNSFYNPLPWASCDNDWNDAACIVTKEAAEKAAAAATNVTTTVASILNVTDTPEIKSMSSAEQFWT